MTFEEDATTTSDIDEFAPARRQLITGGAIAVAALAVALTVYIVFRPGGPVTGFADSGAFNDESTTTEEEVEPAGPTTESTAAPTTRSGSRLADQFDQDDDGSGTTRRTSPSTPTSTATSETASTGSSQPTSSSGSTQPSTTSTASTVVSTVSVTPTTQIPTLPSSETSRTITVPTLTIPTFTLLPTATVESP